MSSKNSPGEVPNTDRIFPTRPVEEGQERLGTPTQSFQSYMQAGSPAPLGQQQVNPSLSPFDLSHGSTTLSPTPDFRTVLDQVRTVQGTLGGISNQLNTPGLKLKQAHKYVLNNKFNEANSLLQSVNNKIGAPVPPEPDVPPGLGAIDKFVKLITHGQNLMAGANSQLASLGNAKEGMISPGDFLQVQIKMNKAQTILEFSSVVLSKAVSGMQQVLNIQL